MDTNNLKIGSATIIATIFAIAFSTVIVMFGWEATRRSAEDEALIVSAAYSIDVLAVAACQQRGGNVMREYSTGKFLDCEIE